MSGMVTMSIKADGYESSVSFPAGHASHYLADWLELQMAFLNRWQPGMTAEITEKRPLPPEPTP